MTKAIFSPICFDMSRKGMLIVTPSAASFFRNSSRFLTSNPMWSSERPLVVTLGVAGAPPRARRGKEVDFADREHRGRQVAAAAIARPKFFDVPLLGGLRIGNRLVDMMERDRRGQVLVLHDLQLYVIWHGEEGLYARREFLPFPRQSCLGLGLQAWVILNLKTDVIHHGTRGSASRHGLRDNHEDARKLHHIQRSGGHHLAAQQIRPQFLSGLGIRHREVNMPQRDPSRVGRSGLSEECHGRGRE